jgi:hypothetical protein
MVEQTKAKQSKEKRKKEKSFQRTIVELPISPPQIPCRLALHHTLASMVGDVTNCLGHGMARQATVLPQRANKENSEMVRDAVVYGRRATKFQRNPLPLSSRYLCLLTC